MAVDEEFFSSGIFTDLVAKATEDSFGCVKRAAVLIGKESTGMMLVEVGTALVGLALATAENDGVPPEMCASIERMALKLIQKHRAGALSVLREKADAPAVKAHP